MNPWQSLIGPIAHTPTKSKGRKVRARDEPASPPPRKQTKHKAGDKVGQWTLQEFIPGEKLPRRVQPRWRCVCDCGTARLVQSSNLCTGASTSCGHDLVERLTAARRLKRQAS